MAEPDRDRMKWHSQGLRGPGEIGGSTKGGPIAGKRQFPAEGQVRLDISAGSDRHHRDIHGCCRIERKLRARPATCGGRMNV
jgi:hypothetical protein